ncbi:MAG TPA: GlsB/YeaQ/YmgE family stress response membrane protein [Pyrinomonadaceae bacterium]|nr:GlsB/YeaQ/YmgE family stress response membrane protein [Pyrinomonadaceae bacterium]
MLGKDPGGIIVTILIGIIGGIIGHYIAAAIYSSEAGTGFIMRLVFAIIGSLILLGGYRLITGRSTSTSV